MTLDLTDIGSNLTHQSFDADREDVICRARDAGVRRQIVTGADLAGSRAAASLARDWPGVLWSTAGVHPHHAAQYDASLGDELAGLLALPVVVAAGECGLDYYRDLSPRPVQRAAFAAQLELAVAAAKPVFLHERDAHADFVAVLRDFRPQLAGGVAHCFTGGPAELDAYLALGLHVGVTGWVCDERRGAALREAVPLIPADRLLIETDAPYLLPRDLVPHPAHRRNEPCHLAHIARRVAALRGVDVALIGRQSSDNAARLFGLPA